MPPSSAPLASAEYLQRFERLFPKKIDLVLTRMERLLAALAHPEARMPPAIHIAGTNGKGSTLAFLQAMCEAAGERVHCYTSPHLVRFHERIAVAGKPLAESALARVLQICEAANRGAPITFFEITTAAAFVAFAEHPADRVLLEVGLGGRLDATNCATQVRLSLLTAIAHDHSEFLGDDLAGIADEKLGIVRKDVPLVVARQNPILVERIRAHAKRLDAPLYLCGEDFSYRASETTWHYQDKAGELVLPLPSLAGAHQLDNAASAVAAARLLELAPQAIAAGVRQARWAGRLQRLDFTPANSELEIWLDGGHNPHAAAALAAWAQATHDRRDFVIIAAMQKQKPAQEFFRAFTPDLVQAAYAVPLPNSEQGYAPAALAEAMRASGLPAHTAHTAMSAHEALAQIAATHPRARVLICGSLYFAGQMLTDFPSTT